MGNEKFGQLILDKFKYDLNPLQKNNKYQPYYFGIMGFLYIVIGYLNLLGSEKLNISGWIWILGGILFLLGSYYNRNIQLKYFIEISDKEIIFKQSMSKVKKIVVREIEKVHFKPISIEFYLNSGLKEEISLGNVGYKNVKEIKAKLKELISKSKITLE